MSGALARLFLGALGLTCAIWLIPASIHLVDWPPTGPVRVALLQPLAKLWWSAAGACFGIVVLAVAGLFAAPDGSDAGRTPVSTSLRVRAALIDLSRALSPLSALWLWLLPYSPWLPDWAPLLLILSGPIRWVVAAAVAGATVSRLSAPGGWLRRFRRNAAETQRAVWRPGLPGRRGVFVVSLAFYLVFGLKSAVTIGPGADEPHYLIIAHSLLVDHDLEIENNHLRRDYRAFYGGELRPDYLQRGRREQIYSIHAPGLPALMLPAYAAAGYHGVVAFMCVLAALAALAVFDAAERIAGRDAALVTWLAVCLTVPFVPHAWLIYPEIPGALIAAWAVGWLVRPVSTSRVVWVVRGAALSLLPWLHTKLVVLLAMLAVCLILRMRSRAGLVAVLVAPVGVSLALWLCSFYWMYGVFNPEAPYGSYPRLFVLAANIPRGVLGLLFDQKFGLLVYAPAYLLAVLGGWAMLRSPGRRALAVGLAAAGSVYVVATARVYMWWGGGSAPARFLVPVLPLAAPMIAVAVRRVERPVGRAAAGVLVGIGLLVAIMGSAAPAQRLLFSEPHGVARLAEAIEDGAPLTALLPTFTEENWHAALRAMVPWILAAAAGLAALLWATRATGHASVVGATVERTSYKASQNDLVAGHGSSPLWVVACVLMMFLIVSAVAAGKPGSAARLATAARGRFALLAGLDGPRLRGFDYSRMAKMTDAELKGAGAVVVSRVPGDGDEPASGSLPALHSTGGRRAAGPFELPPGRYRSRVWLDEPQAPGTGLVVTLGRSDLVLARADGRMSNPTDLVFDVPIQAVVWLSMSASGDAGRLRHVELLPLDVVPRSVRREVEPRAIESIDGRVGAFILYADDETYPEGGVYWTRGTRSGEVLVVPSGASVLALTLHVGSNAGRVHVNVAGRDVSVDMSRDETRRLTVPVPLPPGRPAAWPILVPVVVAAASTFRPADVDRRSDDQRWLGCQVRIQLMSDAGRGTIALPSLSAEAGFGPSSPALGPLDLQDLRSDMRGASAVRRAARSRTGGLSTW